MARENKLSAQVRNESGSSAVRRLRRQGWLPGVINVGKGESVLVKFKAHDFEMMMRGYGGGNQLFDIAVDTSSPRKVLLKEIQHDPITGGLLHADFLEVSMTVKMRARVPVRLVGEPVGVTQEGGILEQTVREVEVECLPGDLMDFLPLDVTGLKVGASAKVSELKVDSAKVTIITDAGIAVASVSLPKEEEVVTPEEAAAAAATEPEVIGRKKDEEGEEGEGAEGEGDAKGGDKKPAEKGGAAAKGGEKPAAGGDKKPAGGDKKAAGGDKKPAGGDKK